MNSAALYCRVSTDRQHPETQLLPLRDYAARRTIASIVEYVDEGLTGATDKRPALVQLMRDAKLRRFDAVIVARFDRFARSTKHLLLTLEEFNALGIEFISLAESIDTSTPMGKMVFTVLGAVAELERDIIRERVTLGLQRAQREGKAIGRPRRIVDRHAALALWGAGKSLRYIGRLLEISKDTAREIINEEMRKRI